MLRRPNVFFTLIVTIPSVILFGGFILLFGIFDRGKIGRIAHFTKSNWSRVLLWPHSVKTKLIGISPEELAQLKGVVFVANHQSLLDIPVLFKYLPSNSSFIAKKELFYIPIFGWAAYLCGTIFIDRSKGSQNKSLDSVVGHLQSGRSIIMFPEGTRSPDGRLKNFKRGAFVFAIQAGAPIVPVTLVGTDELLPKHSLKIIPGEIEVIVGKPVFTEGMNLEDRHRLSDDIHDLMAITLEKARKNRKNT